MVGNSPSNGPFRHAFRYTLPSDNDTQHAINTRVLNEYSINNVNIRKYFTLRVCTAYCIVGHSPLYIYYELLLSLTCLQLLNKWLLLACQSAICYCVCLLKCNCSWVSSYLHTQLMKHILYSTSTRFNPYFGGDITIQYAAKVGITSCRCASREFVSLIVLCR